MERMLLCMNMGDSVGVGVVERRAWSRRASRRAVVAAHFLMRWLAMEEAPTCGGGGINCLWLLLSTNELPLHQKIATYNVSLSLSGDHPKFLFNANLNCLVLIFFFYLITIIK